MASSIALLAAFLCLIDTDEERDMDAAFLLLAAWQDAVARERQRAAITAVGTLMLSTLGSLPIVQPGPSRIYRRSVRRSSISADDPHSVQRCPKLVLAPSSAYTG
jgi:hypothetical protein